MSEALPTLLLIDDEPGMGSLLELSLHGDATVVQAHTISNALAAARAQPPACVLLDLALGQEDGLELAAALRSEPILTHVPIIAFTVHREMRARALQRLDGFIAKPFKPAVLRATLDPYLRRGAAATKEPAGEEELERSLEEARAREELHAAQAAIYARELRAMYDKERAPVRERKEKTQRIRRVIDEDLIETVYQPIVDVWSGAIVGNEALSRFSPEPYRSPDLWFGEAAEVGLGVELELAAARKAVVGGTRADHDAYLSINLSPAAVLDAGFAALFDGVDMRRIVIEITEHAVVEDYGALAAALRSARAAGARVAVDDAGAGFASLRHILRLEPNVIKLDVSLTRGIDAEQAKRGLAKALISFASEMPASVVAEGIETEMELRALRALGASSGQGYLFARPGPMLEGTSVPIPNAASYGARTFTSESFAEAVASLSFDVVACVGLDGRILSLSSAGQQVSGYSAEEIVGEDLERFVTAESVDQVRTAFDTVARAGTVADQRTSFRHRDGSTVSGRARAAPIRDEHGAIAGMCVVFRPDDPEGERERVGP